MLLRAGIQGFRRLAPGYPPPEFRGAHTARRPARSLPAVPSYRPPPGVPRASGGGSACVSPSGPRARSWRHGRACTAAAQLRLVPEQDLVAAVRHDVVDHRRRHERAPPPGTARTAGARQVRSPRPAPAGAIAPARRARTLPVQLRFTAAALFAPGGRCTGGFEGNGGSAQAKPAAAMPGGLILTELERRAAPGTSPKAIALSSTESARSVQGFDVRTVLFSRRVQPGRDLEQRHGPPLPGRGPADARAGG